MCLHSVLNPSPVERVKECRFSNTNKNQNCTKIALGKNTILLRFGYSTWTFLSKRAPRVVTRHSWLVCAVWVCVLGLGFWLRPATPGWGVGACVCLCAHSACTPPLLAGVCGVGVCVWAPVSAAPCHSWLGCWGLCVLVWPPSLIPAEYTKTCSQVKNPSSPCGSRTGTVRSSKAPIVPPATASPPTDVMARGSRAGWRVPLGKNEGGGKANAWLPALYCTTNSLCVSVELGVRRPHTAHTKGRRRGRRV